MNLKLAKEKKLYSQKYWDAIFCCVFNFTNKILQNFFVKQLLIWPPTHDHQGYVCHMYDDHVSIFCFVAVLTAEGWVLKYSKVAVFEWHFVVYCVL